MKNAQELADSYMYEELFRSWSGGYHLSASDDPSQDLKLAAMEIKRGQAEAVGFGAGFDAHLKGDR